MKKKEEVKKDVKKDVAKVDAKKEAPKVDVKAEPKLTLPEMPAGFCLEAEGKKAWEGKEVLFDPNNKDCKSCLKDQKATYKACELRAQYLVVAKVAVKHPKQIGERKVRSGSQTATINEMMLKGSKIDTITDKVAVEFYSGDKKAAAARVNGHIKSVKAGACISSKLFTKEQLKAYSA